jgi:hypothetical protein
MEQCGSSLLSWSELYVSIHHVYTQYVLKQLMLTEIIN